MITRLKVNNFMAIDSVDIRPGRVTVIRGRNEAGKTSVLRAIEAAFRSRGVEPTVIRHGEDKAEILIELSDGRTVQRTITEKEKAVSVLKDKAPLARPQTILDALVGEPGFGFNPVAFFNAKPDDQRKILLDAIPLRFKKGELEKEIGALAEKLLGDVDQKRHALEVLEDVRQRVYDLRRVENAWADHAKKAARKEWDRVPENFDEDAFREPIGRKYEEITELKRAEEDAESKANEFAVATERYSNTADRISELVERITQLKDDLTKAKAQAEKEKAECDRLQAEAHEAASGLPGLKEKLDTLWKQIRAHEDGQALVRAIDRARELEQEAKEYEEGAKSLDALHRKLVKDVPAKLLSRAKLPIDKKITVEDGKVLADGTPLDLLSTSAQFRLALSIARSLAGELKLICLDGAESLDPNHFQELMDAVGEEDGFQYFITMVGSEELTIENVGSR